LPSVQRSCSGSRASCGTVKGCTLMSPTANSASVARQVQQAVEIAAGRGEPRAFAHPDGNAVARASEWAQPMWSPCSWVTKTASMSLGQQPGLREPLVELLDAQPQSTSRRGCGRRWSLRPRGIARAAAAEASEAEHAGYFRSSAITCTMRWALAEASAAPWALSTDTVVVSPWLLTEMRYFSGASSFSSR
jgi:hypothetical protein